MKTLPDSAQVERQNSAQVARQIRSQAFEMVSADNRGPWAEYEQDWFSSEDCAGSVLEAVRNQAREDYDV